MRNIKLLLSVVAIAAAASAIAAQKRALQFVSPVRPPFTDQEGKPRLALDLVEAGLSRLGIQATTTLVPAARYGDALLNGPFDGTAVGWRDADREKWLLFSQPYMENRLVLVGRLGTDVKAPNLAALKGKKIAIVGGYAYGDGIDDTGPTFVRASSEEECLKLLLADAVNFTLMDELVVQYMIDNYPSEVRATLQLGTLPLLSRPIHLTLRRTLPDGQAIIDRFNKELRSMIADGSYHKILRVHWIRADIDGDGIPEYVVDTSNQAGKSEPKRAYNLFSSTTQTPDTDGVPPKYYVGGAIYNGWSEVPDRYKVDYLDRPDNVHPTARLFTFNFKR